MITKEKVCACIVLFNPKIDRLIENISAISPQVHKVFLVNNGSSNLQEIERSVLNFSNVQILDLKENYGIAKALNVGCEQAIKDYYEWILTLDQDSVCYPELVEKYFKYTDLNDVGQMTCIIKDRNSDILDSFEEDYHQVEWAITSASFVKLDIWQKVKGFDEKLFIDGVDYDFSLSLSEKGYKTIKINYCGLLHEVGSITKQIKIFGKVHPVYNHNKTRRYYICRNNIYLSRKHKQLSVLKSFFSTLGRILFVFVYEGDKFPKLKAGIKGVCAGFKIKI